MSEETEGVAEVEVEETIEPAAVAVEEAPEPATGEVSAEAASEAAEADRPADAVAAESDSDAAGAVAPEPEADAVAAGAVAPEPEADAVAPEPEADAVAADGERGADEPELEAVVLAEPVIQAAPGRSEAQLYLCERGHRTLILWGDPPVTCNARKTRNEVCGMTLYHSTELPEQVQKALNPIKASKKKSGKK